MAGPINITINADAGQAESAIESLADSTERVVEGLDDLGDAGKDAGNDIERGLSDAAKKFRDLEREAKETGSNTEEYWRDAADEIERRLEAFRKEGESAFEDLESEAEKAAKKVDRDLTEALDDAGDAASKTGKKMGDDLGDGTRRMSEGVKDFKDEATQNFSEVASSFSGDMDSAIDLVQGTLGGLASSTGLGAPLAIGLAGLGALAGSFYTQWQENAEKTEERISAMYDDMLESGQNFLSESYIQENLSEIVKSEDRLNEATRLSNQLGIDRGTILRGLAGDQDAANAVMAEGTDYLSKHNMELGFVRDQWNSSTIPHDVLETSDAINSFNDQIQRNGTEFERATAMTEAYNSAIEPSLETMQKLRDAQDGLTESRTAFNEASDQTLVVTAEEESALLDLAQATQDVTTAQVANGESADSVRSSQLSLAQSFINAARQAGMSEQAAYEYAAQLGLIPSDIKTKAAFEKAAAEQGINNLDAMIRRVRTMTIGTAIDTRAISNYKPPTKYMDVIARPGKATIT